jgi:anthranilate synthase component 1
MEGGVAGLYRSLRDLNPGPFMGIFKGKGFTLVSSSPERLVTGRGRLLETRPIAGTRPRGISGGEDDRSKNELLRDRKEKAEHLMLVDLARNDLGRVADYGSVTVKDLAGLESYSKVHHLVSVIEARKRKNASVRDVLDALLPGGTITGCPKIRCMEVIRELEGGPLGFYTGSMGYLAPGPYFDLNILIRTFTFSPDGRFELRAGAGIVADSDPGREYLETLYKVEALAEALGTTLPREGR